MAVRNVPRSIAGPTFDASGNKADPNLYGICGRPKSRRGKIHRFRNYVARQRGGQSGAFYTSNGRELCSSENPRRDGESGNAGPQSDDADYLETDLPVVDACLSAELTGGGPFCPSYRVPSFSSASGSRCSSRGIQRQREYGEGQIDRLQHKLVRFGDLTVPKCSPMPLHPPNSFAININRGFSPGSWSSSWGTRKTRNHSARTVRVAMDPSRYMDAWRK